MPIVLKAIRPKKFFLLNPARTRANVVRSQRRYLEGLRTELRSDYSKVSASQNYTRTGDLGAGWKIEVSSDGSQGFLYNDVEYAAYVQGPRHVGGRGVGERQAAHMRKRGWRSISDIARANVKRYTELMNRSIQPKAESGGEIE